MLKPSKIHLHKKSNTLELNFNGVSYHLPAEFLRVHSSSAEVKGHGPGQEVLVHGKINIKIENIQGSGNYGLIITFSDGHNSGIYTWPYLLELAKNQEQLWQRYLDQLKLENQSRDPLTTVIQIQS